MDFVNLKINKRERGEKYKDYVCLTALNDLPTNACILPELIICGEDFVKSNQATSDNLPELIINCVAEELNFNKKLDLIVEDNKMMQVKKLLNEEVIPIGDIRYMSMAIGDLDLKEWKEQGFSMEVYRAFKTEQNNILVDGLSRVLPIIHFNILKEKQVWIVSKRCRDRAPAVVIAYLIKYHKMTIDEAINHVKERLPTIFSSSNLFSNAIKEFQNSID